MGFDHGIALGGLELILDFLAGHFEFLFKLPALESVIDSHDKNHRQGAPHKNFKNDAADIGGDGAQLHVTQECQALHFLADGHIGNRADNDQLGQGLEELHERLGRKKPFEPFKRIDF
jgi:hypothetical protein